MPLSSRAVAVVEEAAKLWDDSGLAFPGTRPGRPLSENMHAKPIKALGFDAVTHGFRTRSRPRRSHHLAKRCYARSEGEKSAGVAVWRAGGGGRAEPSVGTKSGNMPAHVYTDTGGS